jgi:hypothetical protein
MDKPTQSVSEDEMSVIFSGPAIAVNKVYVTVGPAGVRLSFCEQSDPNWYQVNTSDLKTLGLAQFMSTVFASAGTFFLAVYIDYRKEAELRLPNTPQWLLDQRTQWLALCVIAYIIAAILLIWWRWEFTRIRSEHGETTLWSVVMKRWQNLMNYFGG